MKCATVPKPTTFHELNKAVSPDRPRIKGRFGSKKLNFRPYIYMPNSRIKHRLVVDLVTEMRANWSL